MSNEMPSVIGGANNSQSPTSGGVGDAGLPEQRHAGQVGYGPNYHTGPTLNEKVAGLKEELKGKVTRNPDRVQHGRDILSGEDKRRKLTGDDEPSPFANGNNKDSDKDSSHKSPSQPQSQFQIGESGPPKATPAGTAVKQGAEEQAGTVAPQGMHEANVQRL